MKKLLIVTNVDWFLISHRIGIVEKAVNEGYQVYVACKDTGRSNEIIATGARFINLSYSRYGSNPILEGIALLKFFRLYISIRPDIVHHITLKSILYGSLASKILGIHGVLNAISGLGHTFTEQKDGPLNKILLKLLRFSFNRDRVSFVMQNQEDFKELNNLKLLSPKNKVYFTKGSGVDISLFKSEKQLNDKSKVKILMSSRMLWDKGVDDLRKASEILEKDYRGMITFILAGIADDDNSESVPEEYLKDWESNGYVEWIGFQKNMVSVLENSDIVVLPSYYREGMPKSLLEACSMSRPIITTNSVGCKECVENGINGLLVPIKSPKSLAAAIKTLVDDKSLRVNMGIESRRKAIEEFDVNVVIQKHLEIYESLLNK